MQAALYHLLAVFVWLHRPLQEAGQTPVGSEGMARRLDVGVRHGCQVAGS